MESSCNGILDSIRMKLLVRMVTWSTFLVTIKSGLPSHHNNERTTADINDNRAARNPGIASILLPIMLCHPFASVSNSKPHVLVVHDLSLFGCFVAVSMLYSVVGRLSSYCRSDRTWVYSVLQIRSSIGHRMMYPTTTLSLLKTQHFRLPGFADLEDLVTLTSLRFLGQCG